MSLIFERWIMDLRILAVRIERRESEKKEILIKLSPNINFFYGNSGTGKTTLLNLINYALGQDMKLSAIVQKEIKRVVLDIYINGKTVILGRDIASKYMTINDNSSLTVLAKNDQSNRKSFSDYLYETIDQKPIEMVRGKSSKSIRITYANFLWFAYLQQSELDNTLFYLGEKAGSFKSYASEFVLRSILNEAFGAESQLEREINYNKEQQKIECSTLSIMEEVFSVSNRKVFKKGFDFGQEIYLKRARLVDLNRQVENAVNNGKVQTAVANAYQAGKYEGEISYLRELYKIMQVRTTHQEKLEALLDEEQLLRMRLEKQQDGVLEENLNRMGMIFKDTLLGVGFPNFTKKDHVFIDAVDLIPRIYRVDSKTAETYSSLSGGIRTIFKICFAISIYRFVKETGRSLLLPSFLIIDTAMKNISERIDEKLYDGIYEYMHKLFSKGGELEDIQLILVDKEIHPSFEEENVTFRMFTSESRLIPM